MIKDISQNSIIMLDKTMGEAKKDITFKIDSDTKFALKIPKNEAERQIFSALISEFEGNFSFNQVTKENDKYIIMLKSYDESAALSAFFDGLTINQTQTLLDNNNIFNHSISVFVGDRFSLTQGSFVNQFSQNYKPNIKTITATPNAYYLNSYAAENAINTKYGKAYLFLDLKGDGDKLGIGAFSQNSQLFNFDSDKNGIIDERDTYFNALKVRAYDKNGNEMIFRLGEVVDFIDLNDFIDTKQNAIKKLTVDLKENGANSEIIANETAKLNATNPYQNFKAETRYENLSDDDIAELSKLADDDGWIEISKYTDIFGEVGKIGLAYAKMGISGDLILSELTYNSNLENPNHRKNDTTTAQIFNKIYDDYKAELSALNGFFEKYKTAANAEILEKYGEILENPTFKSSTMIELESAFTNLTGLNFSLENLEMVKSKLAANAENSTALGLTQNITAIKINKNGTFTLRLADGSEIIATELYKDSGTILGGGLEINLRSEDELNAADKEILVTKIKNERGEMEIKSLADLGVKMIKSLANRFELELINGDKISVSDIFVKQNFKGKNIGEFNENLNQNSQNADNFTQNFNKITAKNVENLSQNSKLISQNGGEISTTNLKFYPKPLALWA